jgi:hypothetical protein
MQSNGAHRTQDGNTAWVPDITLREMRANLAVNGPQLYVRTDGHRLVWTGAQQAMLVLGPPRCRGSSEEVGRGGPRPSR